jgi:trigger factor
VQKLIEKNPIDVPPSLVQQQQQAMLQEMVQLVRQGIQLPPDLIENSKNEAERRVRAALLLGAVARTREIRVEAQDLDKRIEEIAERSGKHVAKVRAELHGEQRERLESQILEEKLLEYLLAQATISEAAT